MLHFSPHCIGSGRDGINFPPSSPPSAVLCIGSWKGVANPAVSWLLLSSAPQHQGCLSNSPPSPAGWGWARSRSRGGTQPGQLTPTDQRDVPDQMASCSAYKSWGKEGVIIKLKLIEILTFFCKNTTSANILILASKTRLHRTSSALGKRAH